MSNDKEKKGAGPVKADPKSMAAVIRKSNALHDAAKGERREPALRPSVEYALEHAARGFKVFPVKPMAARPPLLKNWGDEATTDETKIRSWWSTWPNANIAIACGPSRLCVVDLDKKNGKDGRLELDALEVDTGRLPPTLTAVTPTGGEHLYFRGEAATTVSRIAPGIDTRSAGGQGGYVLAPGSVRPEGPYKWSTAADHRIADLPTWLRDRAGAPRQANKERNELPPEDLDNEADIEWAKRMLRATEARAEGDGSDAQAFNVACALRDRAISEETAVDLMCTAWEHPHEADWVASKVRNAYAYASGDPGSESAVADFPDDDAGGSVGRRNRFTPLSFAQLRSMPTPKWLAHRLIPDGGLAVVYGPPKAGKTFWALDLSLCVATGRDLHGTKVFRGRVTYVAAEGGPARLRDRVAAWLKSRSADPSEIDGQWEMVAAPVDLANPKQVGELLQQLGGKRDLVVFDTLARCMSGDENSQKDMNSAVRGCDRVRQETGAAVLLVHHEGKDGAKGLRGSTVLRGAIDTGIRARVDGDHVCFVVEDQRDDEPAPPARFEIARIELDGEQSSAALRPASDDFDDDTETLKVRDIAAGMDGKNKKTLVEEVVALLGGSASKAHRRINAAIKAGRAAAVEHDGGLLWLEPDPKNPRGEKTVRFAREED